MPTHRLCLFPDMIMSKSTNNELKFSIRNLIDTAPQTRESKEKGIRNLSNGTYPPSISRSSKHGMIDSDSSSIARPIPLFKPNMPAKTPHPCWSFFSQLTNKQHPHGNLPINSPLVFLSKMNQVWEQIQRAQMSPVITSTTNSTTTTSTSSPAENDDNSDEDIYMDTSVGPHVPLGEEDDDDDDDDDDDEEEAGECSSSGGDKHHPLINTTPNSDDNDKLKTYPCTQCGKVRSKFRVNISRSRFLFIQVFTAQYNLVRHMPVHTGIRPFICKVWYSHRQLLLFHLCLSMGIRFAAKVFGKHRHSVDTRSFIHLRNLTLAVSVAKLSTVRQH